MSRRLFLVAIVLAAAVAAASSLGAQQRGADPNLLRFCPGSGIPCVEIARKRTTAATISSGRRAGFAMDRPRRAATAGQAWSFPR